MRPIQENEDGIHFSYFQVCKVTVIRDSAFKLARQGKGSIQGFNTGSAGNVIERILAG